MSALDELIRRHRFDHEVYVARPTMPPLEKFNTSLEEIWRTRWLTNSGPFHQRFEAALGQYLGTPHVNLFCNGTIALLVALQALRIASGEVITTPFTFPATPHVLHWNGVVPVFGDIDPVTLNLDASKVEALITPKTVAIMPVHVFGNPCDVAALEQIADKYGLKVIYDGAHAFGVKLRGRGLATFGDLTMLSFHATKLFTTVEGGALVSGSEKLKSRVDFLKTFGIADLETVVAPGINGKMNELQSAFGLLQLDMVKDEIQKRRELTTIYRRRLAQIPGLTFQTRDLPEVEHNYAYFPVLVEAGEFGMDRNELFEHLKKFNIMARKYFYPLCTHFNSYRSLSSASPDRLPIAERIASQVLCLPIYGTLEPAAVEQIADAIAGLSEWGRARRS
jgi:dTDP-4-amino-4,6-dideoxygalactose transaminase